MKNVLVLALCLTMPGISAFADDATPAASAPTNISEAPSSALPSALSLDLLYASYFGVLEGSKLDQFGSPYQVNRSGQMTNQPMTFASDFTGAYLITPDIGVGTYIEANLTPFLGANVQFLDVGLTTFDKKIVLAEGLTLYANAIVEAPMSSYDLNRGMYAAFESTPFIRYEVPHSRIALGSWNEIKNYAGSQYGTLLKTYFNPYVQYRITARFSANLGYELEYDHLAGTSGFTVMESDFQPGVIIALTRDFYFNPYLQFFTNNRLTMDSAAFGAILVGRVF